MKTHVLRRWVLPPTMGAVAPPPAPGLLPLPPPDYNALDRLTKLPAPVVLRVFLFSPPGTASWVCRKSSGRCVKVTVKTLGKRIFQQQVLLQNNYGGLL